MTFWLSVRVLCFAVLVLAAVPFAAASAQLVEFGGGLGYMTPRVRQFDRLVPIPVMNGGTRELSLRGKHVSAPTFRLQAALWPLRHLGVELVASLSQPMRSVWSVDYGYDYFTSVRAILATAALRLSCRFGNPAREQLQLSVGPQVTRLRGQAYVSPTLTYSGVQRRGEWGVSGAVSIVHPFSRQLAARAALDANVYRVHLVPALAGTTTNTPLQLDVTPSLGLVVRLP